ncbi:glycoside hydrolase family 16 protein [Mycena rosella]|uniref:Glycoside hydrolase family 16 protein n=1 Tax=Mycena rosella TaxID=1033263 RepID=A0AAD7DVG7_MYCRO|nr:glycoside hydrolase family 16 protein [Mycena rosella]
MFLLCYAALVLLPLPGEGFFARLEVCDLLSGNRDPKFPRQWDYFDSVDPTHGLAHYQSGENATAKHLAFVNGTNMILAVDSTTKLGSGKSRDSVRISSKKVYNAGRLFIPDFAAMPSSCGVWPAWWSVGPSWPNGGEIDVLECIHNGSTNTMTLHTSTGCNVDRNTQMTGKVLGTDCMSSNGNNQGCGVSDSDPTSYGAGFNNAGGGVYAHLWTNDANIWHFTRVNIPADIIAQRPDPSTWPTPTGSFSAGPGCDFAVHFQNHTLTVDTTICGDWAESQASIDSAGCGPKTSADLVADPKNFDLAKWNISSIVVYK